ncbi:hypothetical protein MMC11_002528 [Xylographa trunciseda]|nr:hypothetical protein [Xylographa trunciseda]
MQVNQTLCLPKTCMTHLVGGNDTCASVALQNNIALPILIGYNPAINSQCSNLDLNGSVICLSPAFGTFTPTTISGVAATQTGTYATSTIAPPGATAYKSTTQCGSWYLVHPGDYCGVISLSNGIALSLFMLINPAIDPACDNLVPGLYYCVQPTMDWNITTPSGTAGPPVTQSAPAPTQSGTTSGCFQWYVVAANDTCALIEESYGLTPQQFIAWNPSLNALCTNFILGDAYCVYGPYLSVSSTITSHPTSTTSKSTTTTTSHSSTTSSSSCTKTYTVVSGDTCYIIYTKYALTAAQFMALNPSLNAACALSVGQVVCIAGPTSPTSTSHTSVPTATPTSSCTKNYTVVSGDTCSLIATKFAITAAQLHAWNPTLDAACDLSIGQVLCVASPTSTAPTCPKTYTVVSGDTCYSIYTKLGITDAQLVAWNPTLDAACDLSVGQVLCVAAPISCTKTYTVVSGDSCYSIYTKLGITDAQLVAWNPGLDAACDLSVGQVLCVAA